jgi:hypothetical protein
MRSDRRPLAQTRQVLHLIPAGPEPAVVVVEIVIQHPSNKESVQHSAGVSFGSWIADGEAQLSCEVPSA